MQVGERRPTVHVSFGVSIGAILLRREDTQQFMDLVKMADGYGVEALGTYDSALLGGDTFVRTTLMALASERARIGPRPTNPLTREPQVMASYLASLDSLTRGRAFMDITSGDSIVEI
jgi:5,10-methylenetetrahydromethanopterin reductase